MNYTLPSNLLDRIINDYAEGILSKAELQSFSELKEQDLEIQKKASAGITVRKYLKNLKPVGCRPGFDQRMAAKFAMELERETSMRNRVRITQPAVSS